MVELSQSHIPISVPINNWVLGTNPKAVNLTLGWEAGLKLAAGSGPAIYNLSRRIILQD